jgi:dTDP-L-rhamnose 4-epimerase
MCAVDANRSQIAAPIRKFRRGNGVDNRICCAPPQHETRPIQHLQMLRDHGRLAGERRGYLPHGLLCMGEDVQDPHAGWIAQRASALGDEVHLRIGDTFHKCMCADAHMGCSSSGNLRTVAVLELPLLLTFCSAPSDGISKLGTTLERRVTLGGNEFMHILITGGAGFIGSHLADDLLARGHRVRALDILSPQVHGDADRPDYLSADVELLRGDVRDATAVSRALDGIDVVYHLAAAVGVGQSMYEIEHYTSTNNLGTAVLLQEIVRTPVQRLIVASSMSLYGEGLYARHDGRIVEGMERAVAQLRSADWELRDSDGEPLTPLPTPETKSPSLTSVYALSKFDQERMCLMIGRAYGIPTVALRFFNVFGTRQALSNPYTGVLAIFASRLLNEHPPLIFEDGLQRRDFVSVYDVVQACRLALEVPGAAGRSFNVGSGQSYNVRDVADMVAGVLGKDMPPDVCGKYRVGDIRHCFADISLARDVLGYKPMVMLEDGLGELAEWLRDQRAHDRVAEASRELAARGLTV